MASACLSGRDGLAQRHHLQARRSRKQVHRQPALSIIMSMACRIPGILSTLTFSLLGGSRAAVRSRSGHFVLPFSSRASCSWTRNSSIKHQQSLLVAKANSVWSTQQSSVFSTSARQNVVRKDERQLGDTEVRQLFLILQTIAFALLEQSESVAPYITYTRRCCDDPRSHVGAMRFTPNEDAGCRLPKQRQS
jgi:hypothetical protein